MYIVINSEVARLAPGMVAVRNRRQLDIHGCSVFRECNVIRLGPGLPDFSSYNIPKLEKICQITTKLPNGHKIYKIAVLHSKNVPIFSFPGLPKFSHIGLFGLKMYHLATLAWSGSEH
jgi:hypothetical protein